MAGAGGGQAYEKVVVLGNYGIPRIVLYGSQARAPSDLSYLHTLANIAKFLHKPDFRSALEQAPDADVMLNIIREYGKK